MRLRRADGPDVDHLFASSDCHVAMGLPSRLLGFHVFRGSRPPAGNCVQPRPLVTETHPIITAVVIGQYEFNIDLKGGALGFWKQKGMIRMDAWCACHVLHGVHGLVVVS